MIRERFLFGFVSVLFPDKVYPVKVVKNIDKTECGCRAVFRVKLGRITARNPEIYSEDRERPGDVKTYIRLFVEHIVS